MVSRCYKPLPHLSTTSYFVVELDYLFLHSCYLTADVDLLWVFLLEFLICSSGFYLSIKLLREISQVWSSWSWIIIIHVFVYNNGLSFVFPAETLTRHWSLVGVHNGAAGPIIHKLPIGFWDRRTVPVDCNKMPIGLQYLLRIYFHIRFRTKAVFQSFRWSKRFQMPTGVAKCFPVSQFERSGG